MILLLTNSHDVTTDVLLPHLTPHADVFRFNIDLWRDYRWSITGDGYELADPVGRVCREAEVGAVYERKVMFWPADICDGCTPEAWEHTEVFEIWSGIKDLAFGAGKLALIHPSPGGVWKKMRQMRLASRYFPVPEWEMLHGVPTRLGRDVVCKSNSGKSIAPNVIFKVSRVPGDRLDVSHPWFLQKAVDAVSDVTVVYIAGHLFASELSRDGLSGCDCREVCDERRWYPCELAADEASRIRALMAETGFTFSRLDFLRTGRGLVFLEFNQNGQYGWVDFYNKRGMFSCIATEVLRVHARNTSSPPRP